MRIRFLVVALLAVAGVHSADAATRRLRRIVVVGDSLLAGWGSGGLVERGRPGQFDSVPAFIAFRAHARLPRPSMDRPGVPPQYAIVDANGNGTLDAGEVRRTNDGIGFRSDPGERAHNLAVPGEDTASIFDEIDPVDVGRRLVARDDVAGRDALKFLILGLPPQTGGVSQLSAARDLHPSLVILWIGNNDVLPMATKTDPGAVTLGADEFGTRFHRILNALADTGAPIVVANLPDVTGVAALRHAATDVTSCRAADGSTVPVAPTDLLPIDLDPSTLPVPSCAHVLDASEQAAIRAKIVAFNAEIATAVTDVENARGLDVVPVDMFALFDQARQGIDVDGDGKADVTTRYLGGLFSLDGVHPSRTGNALLANAFIAAIDARFGETVGPANAARVWKKDPLAHSSFAPPGEPPFGLIGDGATDDLADMFQSAFDRIERSSRELGDRARRALVDVFRRFF